MFGGLGRRGALAGRWALLAGGHDSRDGRERLGWFSSDNVTAEWITSAEARADGHRLRAECGAVMVGAGTQQADDPQLAVRNAER